MEATDAMEAVKLLRAPFDDEWEAVPVDAAVFQPGRRELDHLVETGAPVRA